MATNRPPRRYWCDFRSYAILLVLLPFVLWRVMATAHSPSGPDRLDEGVHEVARVVDGQTLLLASGARVRLQGIGIPASDAAQASVASEAKAFTQGFMDHAGGKVRLTFGVEREDSDGHFLAFVWHDDLLLNEELVRAGLAYGNMEFRNAGLMRRRFAAAQEEARRVARGIWSKTGAGPIPASSR